MPGFLYKDNYPSIFTLTLTPKSCLGFVYVNRLYIVTIVNKTLLQYKGIVICSWAGSGDNPIEASPRDYTYEMNTGNRSESFLCKWVEKGGGVQYLVKCLTRASMENMT